MVLLLTLTLLLNKKGKNMTKKNIFWSGLLSVMGPTPSGPDAGAPPPSRGNTGANLG